MKHKVTAWVWRSGLIEMGDVCPEGAIPIITGDLKAVGELIFVHARLSYTNEPLVPGIPEAADSREAFKALQKFICRMEAAYHNHPAELQS